MIEVGQKLYFVPNNRYGARRDVVVTKVGRRWAAIGPRMRVDVNTLRVDGRGYMSPGQCWLSEAAYREELALQAEWDSLNGYVSRRHRVPEGITIEAIRQVKELLKIS